MKQKKKKKYVSKFVELFLNELFVEFILHNSGTWLQCGACVVITPLKNYEGQKKKVEESRIQDLVRFKSISNCSVQFYLKGRYYKILHSFIS